MGALQHIWRWIWRGGRDPLAWLTVALFIIGGIQVAIAEDTKRRQLRAYLVTSPGTVKDQNHETGFRFEARPWIVNKGQTPAYEVSYVGAVRLLPSPLADNYNFSLTKQLVGAKATVGPEQSQFMTIVADGLWTDAEIAQAKGLAGGNLRIVVYGVISYRDAFKQRRTAQFGWTLFWSGDDVTWMALSNSQNAD